MAKRRRLKPPSPKIRQLGVSYPFVALVGRPNVGKSTLFNRLVGQRVAITEPTAGTTRDRIAALVELEDGRTFELCDMGGVGGTGDAFDKNVNVQVDLATEYADLIIFLVDGRAGLTPLDEKIGRRLQKLGKPVLLVVNKVETQELEFNANEFYALGFEDDDLLCVSAMEGTGRSDLLERLSQRLPESEAIPAPELPEGERLLRLAIVGRHVGKSTFVNRICGEERVIASDVAGTTRDAIDVMVEVEGRDVVLIDTAGLRKRGKADDHIEIISHGRADEAIRRSDVALLFLDCVEDIAQVDKRLGGRIVDEHKACVIVANKWDLVDEKMTLEQYADYVDKRLPGLGFAPVVCISALEGFHDTSPVKLAFDLHRQSLERVGTGPLNRAVRAAMERRRPRAKRNQQGKIYFCTQVAVNPVTILLFVNEPDLFDRSWRRYLANQLRRSLPWEEIPIKLCFRARQSLYKKGGGLARRVKGLAGLAEQAVWVDQGSTPADELASLLDTEHVQRVLADEFSTTDPDARALDPDDDA